MNSAVPLLLNSTTTAEQSELKIRQATLDDLSTLLEIEQKVIEAERPFNSSLKTEKISYYDIEALVADENSHLVVAEVDNNIIATGYAQIRQSLISRKHDIHGYLGFMFVSPDFRGKGINNAVIESLIAWGKSRGAGAFYLDVYSTNSPAIKSYEKAGFEPCLLEMKLVIE